MSLATPSRKQRTARNSPRRHARVIAFAGARSMVAPEVPAAPSEAERSVSSYVGLAMEHVDELECFVDGATLLQEAEALPTYLRRRVFVLLKAALDQCTRASFEWDVQSLEDSIKEIEMEPYGRYLVSLQRDRLIRARAELERYKRETRPVGRGVLRRFEIAQAAGTTPSPMKVRS